MQLQQLVDRLPHPAPLHDPVDHPVLQQEFRVLEAFGKRLSDRLLDDPRTRKADQRIDLN